MKRVKILSCRARTPRNSGRQDRKPARWNEKRKPARLWVANGRVDAAPHQNGEESPESQEKEYGGVPIFHFMKEACSFLKKRTKRHLLPAAPHTIRALAGILQGSGK
jgi:hypothetical protein